MRNWLLFGAGLALVAGCAPQDQGVVMGCFGLVNETVGQDPSLPAVVTNMYFGGCSPDDSGMQIVERATQAAAGDQVALQARCDTDCTGRLNAYQTAHPEVTLPLSCQTLFVSECDDTILGADVSGLGASGVAFQAGGPADTRYALTGTVTLTPPGGLPVTVAARGIVDGTMPCAANSSCGFTLSRLDVMTLDGAPPFTFEGMEVDSAHVQNQGLIPGTKTAGNMAIAAQAIEAQISAVVAGTLTTFHMRNDQAVQLNATNPTLDQFLANLHLIMHGTGQSAGVTAEITMQGVPDQHRPVSAITAQQTTYECQCKSCTTASFASAATDQDNDLQSLSWTLNGVPQIGDGTSAPQTLDLQLALGTYTVALVATDTRGAAAASSQSVQVVDTTPPVVTPPPNLTLRECDFPDIGQATATDICSDTIVISNNAPGNFQVGTTQVIWTAEDGSGNEGSATQTVTVTAVSDFRTCCPAGYNVIVARNGVTTNGTSGNDCIIGTDNDDVINGNGGNDIIFGRGGQDHISGGDGDDIIFGGEGVNVLDGGNGNDKIVGGGGTDTITGGAGNDILIGGGGDDTINGGDGADTIYGNDGQDKLTGGTGNDFIDGGPGDDQIVGGLAGATAAQIATGNTGDDVLIGGLGNDTIIDNVGNNTLQGFQGDDHLTGGPGNDTFNGGAGHDTCAGGGGTDAFALCND